MSQKSSVELLVSRADWEPLHALIGERTASIDMVHAWLKERGYAICRSSLGRYMKRMKARGVGYVGLCGLIGQLNDEQMAMVVAFAKLLASGQRIVIRGEGSTGGR